jgi:hypothetical protein
VSSAKNLFKPQYGGINRILTNPPVNPVILSKNPLANVGKARQLLRLDISPFL